jgi:DNA invertase Pin-like site-specific DNA recombinase
MDAARRRSFGCVLVWKFDRFTRSVSHLVRALDEFNHFGIRFASVQDRVDTGSPMGKAMFTIIGAMAELESSLVSERVRAGMQAAKEDGVHVGRPSTPDAAIAKLEQVAEETDLSLRKIKARLDADVSRGVVGRVVKRVRSQTA